MSLLLRTLQRRWTMTSARPVDIAAPPVMRPEKIHRQPSLPSEIGKGKATSTAMTAVDFAVSEDCRTHFIITSRHVVAKETLVTCANAAPYAKVVGLFERRKYCQHCHLSFKDSRNSCKSRSTFDYFGFESCRTLFEPSVAKVNQFVSALIQRVTTAESDQLESHTPQALFLRLDHNRQVEVSRHDLNLMALFVDFLLKRKAERDKKHDSVYNKQVRWGGHCCEEVPEESLRHVHQPSSEDLIGPGLAQDQFSLERQEKLRQLTELVTEVLKECEIEHEQLFQSKINLLYDMRAFDVNMHRIVRGKGRETYETGLALYPITAYFGRDPEPNCEYFFDQNTNMVVRSLRDLPPGERLSLGYKSTCLADVEEDRPYTRWLNL